MPTRGPIERKVIAATAAAYVASTGLLAALAAVRDDGRLLELLPDGLTAVVAALIPSAITAVAGWRARHTPRPDLTGG